MKDITFTLYEREITRHMQGDREEESGWDRDPDNVGEFSTLVDAQAKMQEYAKADKAEVSPAGRYGIGSITRPVYEIEASYEDEGGETVFCDENGDPADDTLDMLDVLDLHPEIAKAWDRAKRELYDFLDYKRDDFGSVKSHLSGHTLHFDLSEINEDYEFRKPYPEVKAWDDSGHEVSYITNKVGEGEFYRIETAGSVDYKQVRGTCQFRLADTDEGIKRQLTRLYNQKAKLEGWE